MLKDIILNDFKSFEGKNVIPIKQITTLIGLNSSGKTNILEALSILSSIVSGTDITAYFNNYYSPDKREQSIRGGAKGCCRGKKKSFTLGCISSTDDGYDLKYQITINVSKAERIVVESESLLKTKDDCANTLIFKTIKKNLSSGDIVVEYNNHKRGPNPRLTVNKSSSVISQITNAYSASNYLHMTDLIKKSDEDYIKKTDLSDVMNGSTPTSDLSKDVGLVCESLSKVKSLNPIPDRMRNYVSRNAGMIQSDASNLSSVLYKICFEHYHYNKRRTLEKSRDHLMVNRFEEGERKYQEILDFINLLPEYKIKGIKMLTTPPPLRDVMFACVEEGSNGDDLVMPANLLSDGLLRITALAVAVITSQKSSILLLDEFDSAIHESKALSLLNKIQKSVKKTKCIVILTTHDTPLLNDYTPELLTGTIIVFRKEKPNRSNCISFYELPNVENLLIKGGLGKESLKNGLRPYLSPKDNQNNTSSIPSWLYSEGD